MSLPTIGIGPLRVSRLILGSNPFSGFSHQSPAADDAMRHYYTAARIKAEMARAERLGITTYIGRADHHIMRVLMEHWDEGGSLRWLAQTCPELGPTMRGVENALAGGAAACYVHGGRMDWLLANDQTDEAVEAVAAIRQAHLPAGIAGHNPAVFDWAEAHLDCDFYMCSYYNPSDRSKIPQHDPTRTEWFTEEARRKMVQRIATLSRPVIHYKILAAGRNDPREAFQFAARHLRPQDAICIGVYSADKPDMLDEDVRLFQEALSAAATP